MLRKVASSPTLNKRKDKVQPQDRLHPPGARQAKQNLNEAWEKGRTARSKRDLPALHGALTQLDGAYRDLCESVDGFHVVGLGDGGMKGLVPPKPDARLLGGNERNFWAGRLIHAQKEFDSLWQERADATSELRQGLDTIGMHSNVVEGLKQRHSPLEIVERRNARKALVKLEDQIKKDWKEKPALPLPPELKQASQLVELRPLLEVAESLELAKQEDRLRFALKYAPVPTDDQPWYREQYKAAQSRLANMALGAWQEQKQKHGADPDDIEDAYFDLLETPQALFALCAYHADVDDDVEFLWDDFILKDTPERLWDRDAQGGTPLVWAAGPQASLKLFHNLFVLSEVVTVIVHFRIKWKDLLNSLSQNVGERGAFDPDSPEFAPAFEAGVNELLFDKKVATRRVCLFKFFSIPRKPGGLQAACLLQIRYPLETVEPAQKLTPVEEMVDKLKEKLSSKVEQLQADRKANEEAEKERKEQEKEDKKAVGRRGGRARDTIFSGA